MKKKVRIYKKPCYECGGQTHMQTGGSVTPEMKAYLEALEFNKEARQAIGTNNREKLKQLRVDKPYNNNDLARDFSELQKLRQAAGLGLMEEASILFPHVGQQIRGSFNEILGTDFEQGGEFEPHMMHDPKTGKGYPAETMEDHLAMKERGFLHKDEMPKKQFGGNQFSKRLGKELKSSYKPFSSTAPQNQNTDEVVGERKNIFVSSLSNNAFKKYAEEEQQSLQELHQQMKMGGNTSYGMYDQYGGQYPTNEYMPKMQDGGDTEEVGLDPTDPYYVGNLIERYFDKYGTTAVKGFGDYDKNGNHPLLNYANSGEAQRAAVIGYMEAMIKGETKGLMKASEVLDETDLPDLNSFDVLPGSDEDKLEDMAAIAREEARANIYDQVMGQVDEIDENLD